MDNKEILDVVEVVSNEKGVERDLIFQALEAALAAAARKLLGEEWDVRMEIDRATGAYRGLRRFEVRDETAEPETPPDGEEGAPAFVPERHLTLEQARERNADAQLGDVIEEPLPELKFGRIATQMAKQVIVQRVREAEREKVIRAFEPRLGRMISGQAKRLERGNLVIDLGGNAEGLLPREEMIPRENIRLGDRVACLLKEVRTELRGPQLLVTRRAPALLVELFRREVPEVAEEMVEIVSAARDPGVRAKIAVRTREPRIDPIGACVGMHGTRVQSVSNELAGERVDIVLWDENPAQFVLNALAPARAVSVVVDEDSRSMDVAVAEDQLSLAIGRGGQNVRLASELSGWTLNIMTEQQALEKQQGETAALRQTFMDRLEVDEAVADILVQEGFTTLEELAFVPVAELLAIEEFDEDIVHELRSRAQDALLTQEISREEALGQAVPADDLLELPGMTRRVAYLLAARGVVTRADLGDCAVDELEDIEGLESAQAAELIMAARADWFADQAQA
jgi:transcription termination/antitermination protein NusA